MVTFHVNKCCIPGTYWFTVTLGTTIGSADCKLYHDGALTWLATTFDPDNPDLPNTVSGSIGIHLTRGGRVSVVDCFHIENIRAWWNTYISGVLVRPDA